MKKLRKIIVILISILILSSSSMLVLSLKQVDTEKKSVMGELFYKAKEDALLSLSLIIEPIENQLEIIQYWINNGGIEIIMWKIFIINFHQY